MAYHSDTALTRNPNVTGGWSRPLSCVWRMGWSYSEQADTVNPLLCQHAAGAAGKAGCEPVATKSIATMIQCFDRGAVVFFKFNLISY